MTDTRKEFEEWALKNDYAISTRLVCGLAGKHIEYINAPTWNAWKSWQACQSLNDKRIADLLAVIAKKDEALSAVDDLIEHQYCGSKDAMTDLQIACDMTHEALALQPSDVELVEVERVRIIDGIPTLCCSKSSSGEPTYTIKTKANTK